MRFLLIFFFLLPTLRSFSQTDPYAYKRLDVLPREGVIKLRPEISALGGVSLPIGDYAKIGNELEKYGAAQRGYFGELRFTQRSPAKPLWNIDLSIGFMEHSVDSSALRTQNDWRKINIDNWSIGYVLPGASFHGGRQIQFELHAAVGAFIFDGWNLEKETLELKNNNYYQLHLQNFRYSRSLAVGIRLGTGFKYKIKKRWIIFADGAWWGARGNRLGIKNSMFIEADSSGWVGPNPNISQGSVEQRHRNVFSAINIGFGIRYVLYKHLHDPNEFYYNFY